MGTIYSIENLKKGAINFLYIFINPHDKGVSKEVMRRRTLQVAELSKVYSHNSTYTVNQLVEIIKEGIVERYGVQPTALLYQIFNASVRPASIGKIIDNGEPTNDKASAEEVERITTTVEGSKKNLWKDILDVVEYIIKWLQKIFIKNYTDPNTYRPTQTDWTYSNRPNYVAKQSSSTLTSMAPLFIMGGIGYYLFTNKNKKNPRARRSRK